MLARSVGGVTTAAIGRRTYPSDPLGDGTDGIVHVVVLQLSELLQLTAAVAANAAIRAATTIRTARDPLLFALIGRAFQLLLCRFM
ncbi:hypothetical protein MGAST_01865 [Mycobacterium gastri 'Wayne']|uniref:Uncharacterized protein n=1 Tax=Mycobacterium gastri TaxID=1777 RepID=A0A1X1VCJ0_MYCGS|nr:hypothetical protein MGAST_01865 [Mycobacterium gastri 'Wayne']ORV66787.1 hypothetical protein AWC07_09985 [Mycobacterium gastri]